MAIVSCEYRVTDSASDRNFTFAAEEFEQLLAAAQNGSQDAMQSISDGCRDYLLLIANQELDTKLRQKMGPSDIVQNSLIAVHQNLNEFRGDSIGQFLAWARKILIHDLHRARRNFTQIAKRDISRERAIASDSVSAPAMQLASLEYTPGTQAVADEESRLLRQALQRLSTEHRTVIELRHWQQMSFAEIGKELDRSADAAQHLWQRAIVKLRDELRKMSVL